jgi:hypothetical protein
MRLVFLSLAVLLCLPASTTAQTREIIIPAGTLLPCTLDEPKFSSATAQVGDPVLCHVGSLAMFEWPILPRGAYLSGRLEEFRDPGHFVGKGSLHLEFGSLTVPGGTFPLSARIISVSRYQVKKDGTIRGHGHARRDAIEWTIPVLWPEKVVTLPMRGPRPELKGETRIVLRILEDVAIPADATALPSAALSTPASSRPASKASPGIGFQEEPISADSGVSGSTGREWSSNERIGRFPRIRYGGVSAPAEEDEVPLPRYEAGNLPGIRDGAVSVPSEAAELPLPRFEAWSAVISPVSEPAKTPLRAAKPIFLVCKDGRAYRTTDYWFDSDQLVYVASDGTRLKLPVQALDLDTTVKLNREHGTRFEVPSKTKEP